MFISFLGMILFMNWTYSFSADDCFYGAVFDGEKWTKVGTIWNALMVSIVDLHRPVVHFFARVFAGCFDKWVFNVANTCVVGVLLLFINRLARRTWRFEPCSLAITIFLVFFVLCKGESYLWCCGSTCYLWAGVMILGFCIFREKLEANEISAVGCVAFLPILAAIAAGNEAYSPPICIGIAVMSLSKLRDLNWKKVLSYGVFGIVALACALYEAKNRAFIEVPAATVNNYLFTVMKITFAVKCVWAAFLCFVCARDKHLFIRDNLFEIVVIAADMAIVMVIGFVPERILWVANMLGVVIVIRSWKPGKVWGSIAFAMVTVLFCFLVPLGCRIKSEFDSFINQYQKDPSAVLCHDHVACGVLSRFFFQITAQWQPYGYHPEAFSLYYGHPKVKPLALNRKLFDGVYKSNEYCVSANRLPISIEAYTTIDSNTIVMPIVEGMLTNANHVVVDYDYASWWLSRIKKGLDSMGKLRVSHSEFPRKLVTDHGCFYLVAKEPDSDLHIRGITLSRVVVKDPDQGMWYTAEELIKSKLYSKVSKYD